jgi:hypothetical protein
MSNTALLVVFLVVLALLLVHYRPSRVEVEGFAVAAVDPIQMPACAQRSPAAQRILAAIAHYPESDEGAAEIRLLLSKLCCMEADVSTAGAGVYRTLPLQFRTSHDMEPPTSFVGRCLRNAVRQRDIDLVMDKFEKRGHALIRSRCPESRKDFDEVIASTRLAFVSFCLGDQPSMDKPMGPRDVGFWAPEDTDLMQYQGVSSSPK